MIKEREKLSDNFLVDIVFTLDLLKTFRFTKKTMNIDIDISDDQNYKLKELCFKNEQDRIKENKISQRKWNTKWSYEVLKLYFKKLKI